MATSDPQQLDAHEAPNRGTAWFYRLLAAAAALVVILPAWDAGRQLLLGTHHLRTPSFLVWAALQPLPSMYNFGNQVWVSPTPLTDEQRQDRHHLPPEATTLWVNHYPTRMMTFGAQRAALVHQPRPMHYYLRSRFGDNQVDSHYLLEPQLDEKPAVIVKRLPLESGSQP